MPVLRPLLNALLRGILPETFIAPHQLACAEDLRQLRLANDEATECRLARWALLRGPVDAAQAAVLIGDDEALHTALLCDHAGWFADHGDGRWCMHDDVRRIVLAARGEEELQAWLTELLVPLTDAVARRSGDAIEAHALQHLPHLLRADPARHEELFALARDPSFRYRQMRVSGDGEWTTMLHRTALDAAIMAADPRVVEIGADLLDHQRREGYGAASIARAVRAADIARTVALLGPRDPVDQGTARRRLLRVVGALHAAVTQRMPDPAMLRALLAELPLATPGEEEEDANDLFPPQLVHRLAAACLRAGVDPSPLLRTGEGWSLSGLGARYIRDDFDVQALHAMNAVGGRAVVREENVVAIVDALAGAGRFDEAQALINGLGWPMPMDRARRGLGRALARKGHLVEARAVVEAISHLGHARRVLLAMAERCATEGRMEEGLALLAEVMERRPDLTDMARAARCHHRLGCTQQGEALVRHALANNPGDDVRGLMHVALACGELGNDELGLTACRAIDDADMRATALGGLMNGLRSCGQLGFSDVPEELEQLANEPGASYAVRRGYAVQSIAEGEDISTAVAWFFDGIDDPAMKARGHRDLARGLRTHHPATAREHARRSLRRARALGDAEERNEALVGVVCLYADMALWEQAQLVCMEVTDVGHRLMVQRYLLLRLEQEGELARIGRVLGEALLVVRHQDEVRKIWDYVAREKPLHIARRAQGLPPKRNLVPKRLRRSPDGSTAQRVTDLVERERSQPGADTQQAMQELFALDNWQRQDLYPHPWHAGVLIAHVYRQPDAKPSDGFMATVYVQHGLDPACLHRHVARLPSEKDRMEWLALHHLMEVALPDDAQPLAIGNLSLLSADPCMFRNKLRQVLLISWLECDRHPFPERPRLMLELGLHDILTGKYA